MGYVGKYPHRIKNASYGKSGIWVITLNNGRVHRINGRDMPGAMPKPGEEISKYLDEGLPMVKLAVNPAKKSVTRLVRKPGYDTHPLPFKVSYKGSTSKWYLSAAFKYDDDAKDYAKSFAKRNPKLSVQVAEE